MYARKMEVIIKVESVLYNIDEITWKEFVQPNKDYLEEQGIKFDPSKECEEINIELINNLLKDMSPVYPFHHPDFVEIDERVLKYKDRKIAKFDPLLWIGNNYREYIQSHVYFPPYHLIHVTRICYEFILFGRDFIITDHGMMIAIEEISSDEFSEILNNLIFYMNNKNSIKQIFSKID